MKKTPKKPSPKVTAPKTHKPKGAPKEKLAYLNKGEMAALVKRKGSPPKKGPKGLPSFVETSGTKSAGSISDSYKSTGGGWNSSNATRSGNTSGVGGGGGGGGGSTGSRGSSTGAVGSRSGSEAPGNKAGGYNSGTSGSRYGGASTQAPGMGRNEGRVGPQNPMGGQGSSFKTPEQAQKANAAYTDRYGFYNKAVSRLPSAIDDIEDIRNRRGPFKGNLPNGMFYDRNFQSQFNPNNPYTEAQVRKFTRDLEAERDAFTRRVSSTQNRTGTPDPYRTPQEVAEKARRFGESMAKADAEADREYYGYNKPQTINDGFRTRVSKASISDSLPNVGVGAGKKTDKQARKKTGGVVRKTFRSK